DPLQIDDMSEAEDTPDHLGGAKAECIQVEPSHGPLPLLLERLSAFRIGKKIARIGIAGSVVAPQRKEFFSEAIPGSLDTIEQPFFIRGPLIGSGGMPFLAEIGEQQVADNGAGIEAHGSNEGEL